MYAKTITDEFRNAHFSSFKAKHALLRICVPYFWIRGCHFSLDLNNHTIFEISEQCIFGKSHYTGIYYSKTKKNKALLVLVTNRIIW